MHAIQSRNQIGQRYTTQQPTDLNTQPHNPHMQVSPKTNNKQQRKQLVMQTLLDRVGLQTTFR